MNAQPGADLKKRRVAKADFVKFVENTNSAKETIELGKKLAKVLKTDSLNLFLWGELGAGKTTLLKGVGEELGVKEDIVSPTFQIVRNYDGKEAVKLIHIDLYRLKNIDEILYLDWQEFLEERAVTVVEWAGRAMEILPNKAYFVNIKIVSKNKRKFEIFKQKKDISWN